MNNDPKNVFSIGCAMLSIFVLIGAIFGVWGLIAPVAIYFLAVSSSNT